MKSRRWLLWTCQGLAWVAVVMLTWPRVRRPRVEHGPSDTFGVCKCGGPWGVVLTARSAMPQSECLRLAKLRVNAEYGKKSAAQRWSGI